MVWPAIVESSRGWVALWLAPLLLKDRRAGRRKSVHDEEQDLLLAPSRLTMVQTVLGLNDNTHSSFKAYHTVTATEPSKKICVLVNLSY